MEIVYNDTMAILDEKQKELITVDVNGNFTLGGRKVLRPSCEWSVDLYESGYFLDISLDFFYMHHEDDLYRLPQMRFDGGAIELDTILSCLLLVFNECCAESGGNIFEIVDNYGIYFEDIFMSSVSTRFNEILLRLIS